MHHNFICDFTTTADSVCIIINYFCTHHYHLFCLQRHKLFPQHNAKQNKTVTKHTPVPRVSITLSHNLLLFLMSAYQFQFRSHVHHFVLATCTTFNQHHHNHLQQHHYQLQSASLLTADVPLSTAVNFIIII